MAQNFFSRFPKIAYNIDGEGTFLNLTNIVNNVNVNSLYANESTYYTFYEIEDGDRPDTISYRLYDTPSYHWTLFIINNDLRNGLGDAWPLSNQQFERMLETEYDKYSAITFLPASDANNGTIISGLFNLSDLSGKYLPYLRVTNEGGTEKAKILKYDNDTLQLVVYDIRRVSDDSLLSNVTPFVKSNLFYRWIWENPFDEESDEYIECEALREEFVKRHIAIYSELDPSAIVDPSTIGGTTEDEIAAGVLAVESGYVFSKQFVAAPTNVRWESYRNAASVYYVENSDGERISRSGYDIITNPDIISPKYISNFEREEIINDSKRKIRVIRPDRILDFVNEYFNVLNG